MAKRELAEKLHYAQRKGKGCLLTLPDVVELLDSIASMSAVILKLNDQALTIGVPAQAVADTIQDCLCLGPDQMEILLCIHGNSFSINHRAEGDMVSAPSLLETLDAWRKAHGKSPVDGVQITIPGSVLYSQLQKAVDNDRANITPA